MPLKELSFRKKRRDVAVFCDFLLYAKNINKVSAFISKIGFSAIKLINFK